LASSHFIDWQHDMTDKEAVREARRLWGRKGGVIHHKEQWLPPWAMRYTVGRRKGWFDFEALGHGISWEKAFEAAGTPHNAVAS
jgi:hypothetical protein